MDCMLPALSGLCYVASFLYLHGKKNSTGKKQQGILRTLLLVLCCEIVHICVRDSSVKFFFEQDSYIHQIHYNIPGLFRMFTLKIKLEFYCCNAVNILCSEAAFKGS